MMTQKACFLSCISAFILRDGCVFVPVFSICGSVSCLFATNPQPKIFVQKTELKRCCSSEIDSLFLLKSLFKTSHSLW